ncbi:MAG: PLP-dependent aminotransferase family protein [Acidobacteriaceae bacterium]|nr:PLP-dependent aminotransferase family protein [Acidobacteriaceae bacterium]
MADLSQLRLDPARETPLYKQLAEAIATGIQTGALENGARLPATRELAGQLGLNRTTVSAAYGVLESEGLIRGHVGRGSFVVARVVKEMPARTDWDAILSPAGSPLRAPVQDVAISFANSRPAADAFPLAQIRELAKQVIDGPEAPEILQLGSPHGYGPLRRYLLEQAVARGIARAGDDLMITNGCQQALDLLARLFASEGESVVVEDPEYHGLVRVFSRVGANLIPVAVDASGMDMERLEEAVQRHRPRMLLVTPSFQNPTGSTLSLERRKRIGQLAERWGLVLVESDIYSELRYVGKALPPVKALDETGNAILLGSYSKVSFPGLRVGWVLGPRAVVARLADAKQISDLHSDQLSQAVLLRFAESGELERHLERTRAAGAARLEAVLRACARYLPAGATYTRPEGGMNLWIELPAPLSAESLLRRTEEHGVNFLPGKYFAVRPAHARGLRISFGGLAPEEITRGVQIIGECAREELAASAASISFEPAAALV